MDGRVLINMDSWITGMDVSTLLAVEEHGGRFYDNGKPGDAMEILRDCGTNLVRLRLWNDPFDAEGNSYGAGGGDIETVLALAKRAKKLGIGWLLDFHYSDFWADPGKQRVPKAWRGKNAKELEQAVYDYTAQVLARCRQEELLPQIVAVGNELSNGLLWPAGRLIPEKTAGGPVEQPQAETAEHELEGTVSPEATKWKPGPEKGTRSETVEHRQNAGDADPMCSEAYRNVAAFVSAGIRAVRDVRARSESANANEPKMRIPVMIHLDNGGNNALYRRWFDAYFANGGEDFEYIGLSYYPFWHGSLAMLRDNMNDIARRYGKKLIVAETSMGFTVEDYASYEKLGKHERKGMATKPELVARVPYPMTPQGQADFMEDLIETIRGVPDGLGRGFIYWEPAWLPVPGVGWANEASCEYIREAGPYGNEWANQALFDYDGNALPALRVILDKTNGFSGYFVT